MRFCIIAALVFGVVLPLKAADFIAIQANDVASLPSYSWTNPAISVTTISGDGRTIAGQIQSTGVVYDCASFSCGISPFKWSLDDLADRRVITTLTPHVYENITHQAGAIGVNALSYDGKQSLLETEYRHYEAAIESNGQVQLLRAKIDPLDSLMGAGMSSEGAVVVGNLGPQPVRWTQATGLQPISGLPNNLPFSVTGVSGNGQVVLIDAQPNFTQLDYLSINAPRSNAYQWTSGGGATELKQLPGYQFSHAKAASFDGTTIIGDSELKSALPNGQVFLTQATRWDHGVATPLKPLSGYDYSTALDVSADGRFAVGRVYNATALVVTYLPPSDPSGIYSVTPVTPELLSGAPDMTSRAAIWDAAGNVFDLKTYLMSRYGLNAQLEGWTLTETIAISDDGLVLTGNGFDPQGHAAIWVAELSVPEPSCVIYCALAMTSTGCRRRRRKVEAVR